MLQKAKQDYQQPEPAGYVIIITVVSTVTCIIEILSRNYGAEAEYSSKII